MRKIFFLFMLFGFLNQHLQATHIVGGDLTYVYLGNNNYRFYLSLYIDCINGQPAAIESDKNLEIGVFTSANFLVQSVPLTRSNPQRIVGLNYECVQPPPNACVDFYYYQSGIVNLPVRAGGYTLATQRCCRNGTITNIVDPGDFGATYTTKIPDVNIYGYNNNPRFKGLPPNFLCVNEPLSFDHTAVDDNGDSLVYSLCLPLHGGTRDDPLPIPVPKPPYSGIVWKNPYSLSNQMGGNPIASIDPVSGVFTVRPTTVGQFVVGICVSEYRNGVLMNTSLRDFQFNVLNCVFDVKANFNISAQNCDGPINFTNKSSGNITRYRWDFGDPNRSDDTAASLDASYIYSDPGEYTVTLEAISNNCKNAFQRKVYILSNFELNIEDTLICRGDEIAIGLTENNPIVNYAWTPSADLNNPNSNNPIAKVYQDSKYKLRKSSPTCYVEDSLTITTDKVLADFDFVYLPPCDGLKVEFIQKCKFANNWFWDFGDLLVDSDTSSSSLYSYYYRDTGIIYVNLKAFSDLCEHDTIRPIKIYFPEEFSHAENIKLCLGDTVKIGPLNDTAILSFRWIPEAFLSDPNSLFPISKPNNSIIYVLQKTYARCELSDTFYITVNEIPDFRALRSMDDEICPDDSVLLTATGNYLFAWEPEELCSTPRQNTTYVKPRETTLFKVTAVTDKNCFAEDTISIYVHPMYEIAIATDTTICRGAQFNPFHHIPESRSTTYIKDQSDAIYYPPNGPKAEGKYTIYVETQCQLLTNPISLTHFEESYCIIDLPNAFSPNQDRFNETYPFSGRFDDIFGDACDYKDYRLIIFNRWGQILWESQDPKKEWDGFHEKTDSPVTVYGYIIQYQVFDWCKFAWVKRNKSGNITVMQ